MKSVIVISLCLLLTLLIGATTYEISQEGRSRFKTKNIVIHITSNSGDTSGDAKLTIYGRLLTYGFQVTGTADGNDVNGCDISIRDEFNKEIVSETNITDAYRGMFYPQDSNFASIPIAGIPDVNWLYNNRTQEVNVILWYETEKDK